jgi:hypothetical protein
MPVVDQFEGTQLALIPPALLGLRVRAMVDLRATGRTIPLHASGNAKSVPTYAVDRSAPQKSGLARQTYVATVERCLELFAAVQSMPQVVPPMPTVRMFPTQRRMSINDDMHVSRVDLAIELRPCAADARAGSSS